MLARALRAALALVALVLPAALSALPSAALRAEPWSAADPTGDVRGVLYDPADVCQPPKEVDASDATGVDLTDLQVRHGDTDIRVVLSVADLPSTGARYRVTTVHLATPGRDFAVDVTRAPRGLSDTSLYREPPWKELQQEAEQSGSCGVAVVVLERWCLGLDSRLLPGRDRIEVTVPRRCVDTPRWVRVGADANEWRPSRAISFADAWRPDGRTSPSWAPFYGDRVRAIGRTTHGAESRIPAGTSGATPDRRVRVELLPTPGGAVRLTEPVAP